MSTKLVQDYFGGYSAEAPHPKMTSTGSEGRCDICGRRNTRDHDPPWTRTGPRYVEVEAPEPLPPLEPYTGPTKRLLDL